MKNYCRELTPSDLDLINEAIDGKIFFLNNSLLDKDYCKKQIKILENLRYKISFLY